MISSEEFARIHYQYIRRSDDQKIMLTGRETCKVRSLDHKSPNYITPTNVPIPFDAKPHNLLFLASLDGMLCVCIKNTCELVVWNPLTHVYKMLSNSYSQGFYNVATDAIGFFVDSLGDYSIMHIKRRRGIMTIWIYSLRSG